jgi:hypothetical protein
MCRYRCRLPCTSSGVQAARYRHRAQGPATSTAPQKTRQPEVQTPAVTRFCVVPASGAVTLTPSHEDSTVTCLVTSSMVLRRGLEPADLVLKSLCGSWGCAAGGAIPWKPISVLKTCCAPGLVMAGSCNLMDPPLMKPLEFTCLAAFTSWVWDGIVSGESRRKEGCKLPVARRGQQDAVCWLLVYPLVRICIFVRYDGIVSVVLATSHQLSQGAIGYAIAKHRRH